MRVAIGLASILLLAGVVGARPQQLPAKFTNLQVLPKDISGADLVNTMKGFTRALGVRCEHCHVGEGDDLTKFDFAADTKPTKATARTMLTMTTKLNDAVKDIGEPSKTPKITCFTCHHGALKPAIAAGGGD
jgi:thioredoxin reductase